MNFRKLLNKETSFIVVNGGGATPLDLDKVKWSNKLNDYQQKKNYKNSLFELNIISHTENSKN